MAIDGLRRMVENRGAETWDTFMDNNVITPIENKINELEESGGLDQETRDKIDEIINNGVSTNLYNPADTSEVDIYVNQSSGNDITGNGSLDSPYASLEKAWDRIPYIVNTKYVIKIFGTYTINNSLKLKGKNIVSNKGQIMITSADVENKSTILSSYTLTFTGINSNFTVVGDTNYTSNFSIADINISCCIVFQNTGFLIKNMDNIKTDTSTVNISMNGSRGCVYNSNLSNGANNFVTYGDSTLYCVNSSITNPNGINFAGYFFSKVYINKNCELANGGVIGKMDETSTLINKIEVTE